MKTLTLTATAILLISAGCVTQESRRENRLDHGQLLHLSSDPSATPLRSTGKSADNEPVSQIELELAPARAHAIEHGETRTVGLITDRRYRHWYAAADLRVRLEGEIGKQTHLLDLLKLAETSEEQFIERFGVREVHSGESADRQLRMFQMIRGRLEVELMSTNRVIAELNERIAADNAPSKHKS